MNPRTMKRRKWQMACNFVCSINAWSNRVALPSKASSALKLHVAHGHGMPSSTHLRSFV